MFAQGFLSPINVYTARCGNKKGLVYWLTIRALVRKIHYQKTSNTAVCLEFFVCLLFAGAFLTYCGYGSPDIHRIQTFFFCIERISD